MKAREINAWLLSRRLDAGVAFAIAFVGVLIDALLQGYKPFYYDSGSYWSLGNAFFYHHHFSLLNFNSPLRGYLWPLVDHGLQVIASALGWQASSLVKLFNALVFVLIGTVLMPWFAEISWPRWRWGIGRRLLLVALLLLFWRGFLSYPLSDFPALAFTILAVVAIARPESGPRMALAGIAAGAALEMRPSYVLLVPILAVLVAWSWVEDRRHASAVRRLACIALMVIGFVVVSVPQSLATHRHFGLWSPIPGEAVNLAGLQYTGGLELQRYETYVGSSQTPRMLYEDADGQRLLATEPGDRIETTSQYLALIVDHPIEIAGVFARHIINGIDQRYSTPYVERLDKGSQRWFRIANLLIIFLALLRVAWPASRRRLAPTRWRYPASILICCLTAVPSAIETRYLLPAYLLAYALVLMPAWPSPFAQRHGRLSRWRAPVLIVGSCAAFLLLVLHVVSQTSSSLHFG